MNHSNLHCLSGKTFLLCVPCVNFVSLVVHLTKSPSGIRGSSCFFRPLRLRGKIKLLVYLVQPWCSLWLAFFLS